MPTLTTALKDWFDYWLVDHGFLRAYFTNRYELPGPLYRANQPSPGRLRWYRDRLEVRTVVNLRGEAPDMAFYRMEERACQRLGLQFVNARTWSRGLLEPHEIDHLKTVIDTLQTPAVAHCKSGADRAGFFAVLWRHWRLGEPIGYAMAELHWRYGHSSRAKTGMLDHFLYCYLRQAKPGQSFIDWVHQDYDMKAVRESFQPRPLSSLLIDKLLQRE